MNWGGVAVDPQGVVSVNTNRTVHAVKLIPRAEFEPAKAREPDVEISPQAGAPFGMRRAFLASPFGTPCNPPPWGAISAIDLRTQRILWEVPLGTTEDLAPLGIALKTGTPNFGGPVATAGGLVFIGAAMDSYLRAFDQQTGKELWAGRRPAAGMATPMTYVWTGRPYVVGPNHRSTQRALHRGSLGRRGRRGDAGGLARAAAAPQERLSWSFFLPRWA